MTGRNVRLVTRVGGAAMSLMLTYVLASRMGTQHLSWIDLSACALFMGALASLTWSIGIVRLDIRRQRDTSMRPSLASIGARELSILFVDIRGYTSLTENMSSEEVFLTVSSFARRVSQIVVARGGHVLELAGDGVMAAFEGNRETRNTEAKEQRAVAAGLELAQVFSPHHKGLQQISVGVGIATGDAYIGVISLVERDVRGALGNVTSLASRLQSMTRQLDATVVIDERTHAKAGPNGAQFVRRPNAQIRGRRQPVDIFVCADKQPRSNALGRSHIQLRSAHEPETDARRQHDAVVR